jgi:hypothetical protein
MLLGMRRLHVSTVQACGKVLYITHYLSVSFQMGHLAVSTISVHLQHPWD